MAVSRTNLTAAGDSSNDTSYETASINPTPNKLILITITSVVGGGSTETPTVTGAGMTWVLVKTQLCAANPTQDRRTTMLRALKSSPGTGVLTIDFNAETQARCGWSIEEFTGVDPTGTDGANAIVQSAGAGAGAAGSLTVTLAAFSDVRNATYGGIGATSVGLADIVEGSGFTETADAQTEAGNRIETEFKATNDTSVDWSWVGDPDIYSAGVAVELKAKVGLPQMQII